ncbi:MAG: hypothetical protein DFNUSKGM_002158 [Candidatus Fervidibacter sacchari]
MGRWYECPHCGNTEPGDVIYECSECGEVFCSECAKSGFLTAYCPACGSPWPRKLGVITEEEDDN